MNREITMRDCFKTKSTVTIPDFEEVAIIVCKVVTGDEILDVEYEDGKTDIYDSDVSGRLDNYFDGEFIIYEKDKVDKIEAFSKRNSSYDELEGENLL